MTSPHQGEVLEGRQDKLTHVALVEIARARSELAFQVEIAEPDVDQAAERAVRAELADPSRRSSPVGEFLMDAEYQAQAFFGGPTGPNHGSPRGLLDIPHWEDLPKGAAAQAVEVSAYPDRYAAYEPVADAIVAAMASASTSGSCSEDDSGPPLPAGFAGAFIAAAKAQLGKPYVWGGGTYTGPSGVGSDGRGPGFDCSGLVLYAAYQATNGDLRLPHYSGSQITFGRRVDAADKQPGDLVFFTFPGSSAPHHVAIYVGNGQILHAPRTGDNVRFGTMSEFAGEVVTVRRLG